VSEAIIAVVAAEFGISLAVEGTGGNCTALCGRLETGHELMITGGDATIPEEGDTGICICIDYYDGPLFVVVVESTAPADAAAAVRDALRRLASGDYTAESEYQLDATAGNG